MRYRRDIDGLRAIAGPRAIAVLAVGTDRGSRYADADHLSVGAATILKEWAAGVVR